MSQRQLLIGGVVKTILPLPTLFAEPTVYFVNRDDTASLAQTEATYINLTGLPLATYFQSWFVATESAVQNNDQKLFAQWEETAGDGLASWPNSARLPSGQSWFTTAGVNGLNTGTAWSTQLQSEDAAPLGGVLAAGHAAWLANDIGVVLQDWFSMNNFPLTNAGNDDTDNTATSTDIDIQGTEDYLIFWSAVVAPMGTDYRNVRFNPLLDGVDFTGVRTNSTSGGATRTGRGFSVGFGDAGISLGLGAQTYTGVTVAPLEAGLRTPSFKCSTAEDLGGTTTPMFFTMFAIRKAMFEQAEITKVTARQQNTSETHLDTDFEVSINSTKKVMILVSSTYMGSHPNMEVVLKREAAGGGGDVNLIQPIELRATTGATTGQLLNTDQSCYPLWLMYIDDNPGDVVYKLQLGRNVSGSDVNTINMRDDGTDGFNGYIMALELSFGTDT